MKKTKIAEMPEVNECCVNVFEWAMQQYLKGAEKELPKVLKPYFEAILKAGAKAERENWEKLDSYKVGFKEGAEVEAKRIFIDLDKKKALLTSQLDFWVINGNDYRNLKKKYGVEKYKETFGEEKRR